MRWLIRRVLKKGKGAVSYEEDVHYGDVLTIGRAADQAIFLPDLRAALNHARVTLLSNGQYKVESLIIAGIRVNGDITYATTVAAGAVVEIGNTRLTLLPAPQDFDGGVEISTLDKTEQQAEKEKRAKPTRLVQTRLSKRTPAWILFTLILVFALALPMMATSFPVSARCSSTRRCRVRCRGIRDRSTLRTSSSAPIARSVIRKHSSRFATMRA